MKRMKICVAILILILSFNTSMLQADAAHTHGDGCYTIVGGHSHTGSAASGGGCYTVPIYHSHTGSAASGGGCYTVPIYHSHTGSASSGGGCYTVPVYHTHTGSASSGGGCYGNPHTVTTYCTISVYRIDVTTYTCSVCHGTATYENYQVNHQCNQGTGNFHIKICGCGRSVAMGSEVANGTQHAIGSTTVYDLICGKTLETVEAYEIGCGQDETAIIGYECGCGKTESTIEGYSLGCGQTECEGVRTLTCTIPESASDPVLAQTPTPTPTLTPEPTQKPETEVTPQPTKKPEREATPVPTQKPDSEPTLEPTPEVKPTPIPTKKPTPEPAPLPTENPTSEIIEIEEENTPTVSFSQVAAMAAGTSTATGGMVWVVFFWFFRKCKVIDTKTQQVVGTAYIGKRNNSYAVNISKRLQNKCGEQITLTFGERFVKKNEEENIYITVGDYQYKKVIREEIELNIQED